MVPFDSTLMTQPWDGIATVALGSGKEPFQQRGSAYFDKRFY